MESVKLAKLSQTAFAAALFCSLIACAENPNPNGVTDTGTISGRILDSATGNPLATAQIAVGTIVHNVTPNDKGGFSIHGVPVGNQTVYIRAIGYKTDTETILVTKDAESLAGDTKGYVRLDSTLTISNPSPSPSPSP